MRSHIPSFAEHLQARHLAPGTLAPYLREIEGLARLIEDEGGTLDTLSLQQVTQYLVREGRATGTARRARSAILQFLTWRKHPVAADFAQLRMPHAHAPAPEYLGEEEERALRRTLKARTDQRHHARDRALLSLMLDTGMRVGEVVQLQVGNVDLAEKRVRLVGKGGKQRSRFLPSETRELLAGLVVGQPAGAPVFLSQKDQPLCDRQVRRMLSHWAALAGITRPVYPHILRHTFATSLLKQTGNLRLVQLALDHESPRTTAIYAHVANAELETALERRTKGN
ncbi:MAG: tyrosine-type recombinase/integrase [Candidatus Delongbacteria bacterium]